MTVKELIKKRRTIRKFSQDKILENKLVELIDAARLMPSAANLQPLKYISVTGEKALSEVFGTLKWAGYLKGEYTPKENERPTAYIVVCVDTGISKANYDMDIGAAVENIILSALEDGIGACWLGSVDRAALRKIIGLEDNFIISCVVALGYPAESPKEAEMQNSDVKYYLKDSVLNVPKRSIEEVVIKKL